MSPDARVLASEADLVAAIAAAEQVDAQELVEELIGQLVALQAARQQQRRAAKLPVDPFAAIAGAMADPTWDEAF